jgi:hypothetical protein
VIESGGRRLGSGGRRVTKIGFGSAPERYL